MQESLKPLHHNLLKAKGDGGKIFAPKQNCNAAMSEVAALTGLSVPSALMHK
ncbi:hypothetical protein [Sporisorium scitamineum]|uniref:Uncharacterized protein n=1 Tax=Sporisorium scitamineum TaxID=49012 RepID=A0A0F7SDI3_9BASI|nr:hypothetical protein [Sporisorium scitamineum]